MKKKINLLLLAILLPLFAAAQGFLHTDGHNIVNGDGESVILRGIGTGNWMIMEGYLMKSGEYGTHTEFKNRLIESIGVEKTDSFYNVWLDNHFTRADVDSMKAWGFNSVRPAMHYKWFTLPIEEEPVAGENTWLDKGFQLMDSLVVWASDNEMYVIFDMHGAPGGQGANKEISDYDPTKPSLWESQENKDKTVALWRKIAERYADEPWVGGYDLINETNWTFPEGNNSQMRELFGDITDAIREVDTNHMIIIEGNSWANDHSGLTPPWDDNFVYSFHKYWSGTGEGDLDWVIELRDDYNVPLWLGEAGENGNAWFTETISLSERNNIGWSWWPVKKNDLNCVLFVDMPGNYDTLMKVWNDELDVTMTEDEMFQAVLDWAENHKIENCEVKYDVIDAMIRQPHSNETLPFTEHQLTEPIYFSDFDYGRKEYAYDDADAGYYGGDWTAWNNGWSLRSDGVDIETIDDETGPTNGYNVGWTNDDEWMLYSLTADSTAAYTLEVRSATNNSSGCDFHLEINGVVVSDVLSLPGTGGWQSWQNATYENIIVPEGDIKIKFYLDKGGSNLSYFNFINPKSTESVEFRTMAAKSFGSGDSIMIDLSKAVTSLPGDLLASDFDITVNGESVGVTGVSISSESPYVLVLTHNGTIFSDNDVKVSYSGSSVQHESQNLTAFTDYPVTLDLAIVYWSIPGLVQVEDYVENFGFGFENAGTTSGYTDPGDYLTYRISVADAGYYQINYRVATIRSNAKLIFQTGDGTDYTSLDTITFTSTGGWSDWETQSSKPIYLESGYYFIKLLVLSSEHNLDWFELETTTASVEKTEKGELMIYPNPASDYLMFDFSENPEQSISVSIMNTEGRVLNYVSGINSEYRLDISNYSEGLYLVRIITDNNIFTKKVLVKK
jgi:endoglucanase